MSQDNLKRLLSPKTVAVVGGKQAAEVIRQCKHIGFAGEIWPVNPNRESIEGYRCYASIGALPKAPDASFIAVPREATVQAVAMLAKRGAGGAVCYASGFAEVGAEGRVWQDRLVASMGDMAIIGPNCYGLLNYCDGLALWPDRHGGKRVGRGVAVVMQSGNIAMNVTMQERSLPLAYLISVGNQAGLVLHDYIKVFLEDERITAIGLHIEGLRDVAAFSEVALEALKKKIPIVVLKTGASEAGKQITLSHTSSLSGADKLYDALFERFGILRVDSLPQFIEALKFFSVNGALEPGGIASISCSGGEAALMADLGAMYELNFPALTSLQRRNLLEVLGSKVELGNPLDYHTYIWGDEEAQTSCFAAMMQGEQALTLKVLDYPKDLADSEDWDKTARALMKAQKQTGKKAAVVSSLGETLPRHVREMLFASGIAPMQGMAECFGAIQGAIKLFEKQQNPNIEAIAPHLFQPAEAFTLNEYESKALLKSYGIPVPESRRCKADEVLNAAEELGFPVVLKILSDEIIHKSDVGGVALNLQSPAQLFAALVLMKSLGVEFLVEGMATIPVAELILGITRDSQFGLSLLIGAGGILVELFQDSQTLLFPVAREDVERALKGLKIAPLLRGYRGAAAADESALIEAILNLARFAEAHHDKLLELDINPLFVFPEGKGVLALDAVIRMVES